MVSMASNAFVSNPNFPLEARAGGLYLPALDLYLDPAAKVARAYVSHAHGDHIGGHGSPTLIASRVTLSLIACRRGVTNPIATPLEWGEPHDLAIAREFGGGTARLHLVPSGHILGAAQLVIDHPKGRLVYTGDYRSGGGSTHDVGAPVVCDELIIESTFALPIFRFPPRERVRVEILDWCRRLLFAGELPVLLAYALGKSQELVHMLLDASLPVVAHGAIYRMCQAYEALGVPLGVADGRLRAYAEEKKQQRLPGILVVPQGHQAHSMVRKRKDARIGYVSGWAMLDSAIEQQRADAGFPLSDHADWDDLVATVGATGARRVSVTHGDAAVLTAHLIERGIAAQSIDFPPLDAKEEVSEA
ncbi:MAG: ligase-associated DNA damage response exonuclease [Polyangiales bacterium]